MNTIGSLLVWLGDLVRTGGQLLLDGVIRLLAGLDAVLQPIMSPVLSVLNPICTAIGDAVYAGLRPFPVWLGLTIISVVTGVVMLVGFRYLSNQTAIGRAKDDIKANLLALKLYKDELAVTFRAQGRLLGAILRLQRYVLTPVLILSLPMLLLLAQMGIRYQWRPLQPGEQTLVTLTLNEPDAARGDISLVPGPGAAIEVDGVPGDGKVVWRVRGAQPGRHTLRFEIDGHVVNKDLVVSTEFERISALRMGSTWTGQLLHPAESSLPGTGGVSSIAIAYPGASSWFRGPDWWILSFFVLSMLTAITLKPLFRVKF